MQNNNLLRPTSKQAGEAEIYAKESKIKMGKLRIWLIAIVGLVLLAPVGAAAYTQTITDSTLVIPYKGTAHDNGYNSGNPMDVIAANPVLWNIDHVDVTWSAGNMVDIKIYTGYAPGGQESAGQGDIALSPGGGTAWDYGISMVAANQLGSFTTSLVPVSAWLTTKDIPIPQWNNGTIIMPAPMAIWRRTPPLTV